MKTPPFLLAAALLFWGWQTDFLLWSALMAVAVESSRVIKWRIDFSDTDYNRVWDLCGLLFAGAFVLVYNSHEIHLPAFVFPQWLPFAFLPMMLAQAFGNTEEIGMKTYSWFLRWRKAESNWSSRRLNFSFVYFAICIFGASTTNKYGGNAEGTFNWFYPGVSLLIGWALFCVRPKRVNVVVWLTLFASILGISFVTHRVLHESQARLETAVGSWLIRWLGRRHTDWGESRTSIGQIGKLKLSGKIILRVQPNDVHSVPDLLREATYITYKNENWYSTRGDFSQGAASGGGDSWTLTDKPKEHSATVSRFVDKGSSVLALPVGSCEITNLPALLKFNEVGTVRVDEAPGFLNYSVGYANGAGLDAPPRSHDTKDNIPETERPALQKIVHELQLDSDIIDDEKLRRVAKYFTDNFSYSTYISAEQIDRTGERTPLTMFLEQTHRGHCEYFATATVLLLREAGIPARYATGFAVMESSKSGKTYIVRERHAHAWCVVWHNGKWENFDTTPASWDETEEKNASAFEPLSDLWSRISFAFGEWRYGKDSYQKYLIWALIPLIGILVWRIVFRKERKKQATALQTAQIPRLGLDSEFYQIEQRLAGLGFIRRPEETVLHWRKRLGDSLPVFDGELDRILILHQRHRFDPNGLSEQERNTLRKTAASWLERAKGLEVKT